MNSFSPAARIILVAAAVVVVILGARLASTVLTPILLALVVAIIWSGFPSWLRSRGIRGPWTTIVCVISVVLVFAILGLLGAYYAFRFDQRLPHYEERLDVVEADIESFINDTGISEEPVDVGRVFSEEVFSGQRLASVGQYLALQAVSAIALGALVFIFMLFMLTESSQWSRKFAAFSRAEQESDVGKHIAGFVRDVRQWLLLTLLGGAMVAVPCTILLMIFQVDFAILWGMLIVIGSFVPNVGFIVSVAPPVAIAWLLHGPLVAGVILAFIIVINTAVDNFIKPRIMGRSLGLSPLVTLIAVVFWSWVLGPLGAFLSMPLTLMMRFLASQYEDTAWIAGLMGQTPPKDGETSTRKRSAEASEDKPKPEKSEPEAAEAT
jgi:predicted PurR-regulated permease PerM